MGQPRHHVGFRYLTRFRCLAAACEETCCVGWQVSADQTDYETIKQAMSRTDEERAEFERSFYADSKKRSEMLVVLRPDGSCTMFDEDRLCSLQRRYGEAVLPSICSSFPRYASRLGERIEVTATLSCPEMARLCLLTEDATELIDLDPQQLGRLRIYFELEKPKNLYEAAFPDVQSLAMHLFAQRQFPIRSRLFFLSFFAHKCHADLRQDGGKEEGQRLQRLMGAIAHPEALDGLHRQLVAMDIDNPFATSLLTEIWPQAWKDGLVGFCRLLTDVMGAYATDPDSSVRIEEGKAPSFEPRALHRAFRRRCPPLSATLEARIDLYFENFCTNYIFHEWYLSSASLLRHVLGLLIRVVMIRFLLHSHPAVVALAQGDLEQEEQLRTLDQVAVQVFYCVTRTLDHSKLMSNVQESMAANQMETLNHALCLIKF